MYGSSRLGTWNWNKAIPARTTDPQSETDTLSDWYMLGSRNYELSNHLGNVLSVITDKKIGVSSGGSVVDYYRAEVLSQQDYYPFGMLEPGRSYNAGLYAYGFNGKRMERVGSYITNLYNYGMRMYDARVARFGSVDPLAAKYSSWSPYNFTFNNPINLTDPNGADPFPPSTFIDENGNVIGGTVNDNDRGVYQVSGLTRANFDVNKISQYKQEGTRVGETYSLYTFLNPEIGKWMGKVNFNYTAKNNLSQATKGLGSFMLKHSTFQSLKYYMSNAANFGIYDIKTLGIPGGRNSSPLERTKYAYEASCL